MTVPVWKKGRGLQKINEVQICHEGRWQKKHLETLKVAYGHAPYLGEHLHLFEDLFSGGCARLIDMNLEIIRYLFDILGIDTEIVLLSQLGLKGRGPGLLVDICKVLGGSVFLAQRSLGPYLDESGFARAGMRISYVAPPAIVYPQLWGGFIGNLSVFDLLFNCGPRSREIMVQG